jgi:hypothetical protein
LTYNTFIKPVITNGAVIWYPSTDPDSAPIKQLQLLHNVGMRLITGTHRMASQDHLLAETEMLPVADHLNMVCAQFLASASNTTHTSNVTVNLSTGDRPSRKGIVHTLQSRFVHVVQLYLTNGLLAQVLLKRTLKAIHTNTVTANKRCLNNKLLGGPSPDIDPSKMTLQ